MDTPKPESKPPRLTVAQRHALEWLPTVGKATPGTLRRHGISERTLRSLAARGLVDAVYVPSRGSGFSIYRPKP